MKALTRRRFLTVCAAALATSANARPVRWRGYALGAEISLTIHAQQELGELAIRHVKKRLLGIGRLFSLYDTGSTLSRLNRTGQLANVPDTFRSLLPICSQIHAATQGTFDPTIQSLWQPTPAVHAIGWSKVEIGETISLGQDQQLTLNGVAQGFATDLIRADLVRLGLEQVLVNIGEFSAIGGPFTLGIADPARGLFATRVLTNRAIATSSPAAMMLRGQSHIRHPFLNRRPQWSTVSVEADSAAVADAASTAFSVMTRAEIVESLTHLPEGISVTLLPEKGAPERI